MDIINVLVNNWQQVLTAIVSVVGVFSLIATVTPNKTDDKIGQFVLDAINFLGANFGKAKNDPSVK